MSKLFVFIASFTLLISTFSARSDEDFHFLRFGLGVTFHDGSTVPGALLDRTGGDAEDKRWHRRKPPEECFKSPGITKIENTPVGNSKEIFDEIRANQNGQMLFTYFCGDKSRRGIAYIEISKDGTNWQIWDEPNDDTLNDLLFEFLQGHKISSKKLSLEKNDQGFIKIGLVGTSVYSYIGIVSGVIVYGIIAPDDKSQVTFSKTLEKIGFSTDEVMLPISEKHMTNIATKYLISNYLFNSYSEVLKSWQLLILLQQDIAVRLSEAPLLQKYEGRTLQDKYGLDWETDLVPAMIKNMAKSSKIGYEGTLYAKKKALDN